MPFKSEAQKRYLYAKKPEVAKEFAKKEKDHKSMSRKKKKMMTDNGHMMA